MVDETAMLVGRVARGDEGAFERLYDLMAPAVFGVVRRVLRDPAQSEDVAQEVLVELWRSAGHYDAAMGTVRTWALTLAHRRAVDRVRHEERSRARVLRVARPEVAPAEPVPDAVIDDLDRSRVRAALGELTDLQRQSVELAYFGGYTHTQIAELLGIPLGTVKTRIRDGLIRLRDTLGVSS